MIEDITRRGRYVPERMIIPNKARRLEFNRKAIEILGLYVGDYYKLMIDTDKKVLLIRHVRISTDSNGCKLVGTNQGRLAHFERSGAVERIREILNAPTGRLVFVDMVREETEEHTILKVILDKRKTGLDL